MALNLMPRRWFLVSLLCVFQSFAIPICHSQQLSPPQNIETFYPPEISSPNPPTQLPEPPHTAAVSKSSSSNSKIAKAVAATAAGTLVMSGLIFFLVQRCSRARRRNKADNNSTPTDRRVVPQAQTNVFERIDGNVRGLIVDESGLDVVYWRKLEGKNSKMEFQKEVLHRARNKERQEDEEEGTQGKKSDSIQEFPLLRGKSSASHINIVPEEDESNPITRRTPPSPPLSLSASSIPKTKSPAPPRSPPLNPGRRSQAPPPPTPILAIKSPTPPPSLKSSSKPPPTTYETPASTSNPENPSGEGMSESGNDQAKLKPFHWDKVDTNTDHSMVWDKMDRGSFRIDHDLMEALFGYVATNRRSPKGKGNSMSPSRDASPPSTETFLLDPRKSQIIAIVLKSLQASREEILHALKEGQGLDADIIEKLARIAPTEEEQSRIIDYKEDPARLSAAESFLYHILKVVPSAFKRLNAMLFRLNYDFEVLETKASLQTLELGCKELRNRGLFVKLLEAVLKAGNRMNAGTSRGNAQAFNLGSLRKLSDVKSADGKTTLLHFVVEEVVRSEGKRCVLNQTGSLSRNSSRSRNKSGNSENSSSEEQREREYITLGLPIVGGISNDFSNVKKVALIDYSSLVGSISTLSNRLVEIQQLVSQCRNDRGGKFVKEMDHFLENAEKELKLVRDEQTRVMQIVKRTRAYYNGGASKDITEHSLEVFVIVKDFLGMVDQACIEIARNMQNKRITAKESSG